MASHPWRRGALAGVVVALVVSVAVVATSGGDRGSLESSSGASTPDGLEISELLDFEAPLLDGETLRGTELRDSGVALWFWAPW